MASGAWHEVNDRVWQTNINGSGQPLFPFYHRWTLSPSEEATRSTLHNKSTRTVGDDRLASAVLCHVKPLTLIHFALRTLAPATMTKDDRKTSEANNKVAPKEQIKVCHTLSLVIRMLLY